jgi:hypothetical protein
MSKEENEISKKINNNINIIENQKEQISLKMK